MNRATSFLVGLLFVACALVAALGTQAVLAEPDRPPHPAPPAAEATAPFGLAVTGGDSTKPIEEQVRAWFEGVEREQQAQAALEDLARRSAVRSPVGFVGSGDCAALAAQFGLPESVLWRESRCSLDAYNATGCSNRGCVGAAQLDAGHFAAVSPWNPGTSGACYGLDPSVVADQVECASRLPASAWG